MIIITEGSDELIQLDIKDNALTAINIDDLENIKLTVTDNNVKEEFILTGATGSQKDINIISATQGQVNFVIDRNFTTRNPGISFDLIIELIFDQDGVNTYYLDNKKHSIYEYEKYIKIERVNL